MSFAIVVAQPRLLITKAIKAFPFPANGWASNLKKKVKLLQSVSHLVAI